MEISTYFSHFNAAQNYMFKKRIQSKFKLFINSFVCNQSFW